MIMSGSQPERIDLIPANRSTDPGSGLAQQEKHLPARLIGQRDKFVPLFDAEMGNVDTGRWIVGQDFEHLTRFKTSKPFARLEDRQRAQEAGCVERLIGCLHGLSGISHIARRQEVAATTPRP